MNSAVTYKSVGFAAADAFFASRPYPASMATYRSARTAARRAVLARYGYYPYVSGRAAFGPVSYDTAKRNAARIATAACAPARRG